jgi:hypothetical protein
MHDVHPKWLSVRRLETVQLICSVSAYMYRLSSAGGPANFEKRRLAWRLCKLTACVALCV